MTFPLSVSANKHYFVDSMSVPRLLNCESAWLLFNELSLADAVVYMTDRAARGVNCFLAQVVSKVQSNSPNNNANDAPFTGNVSGRPDFTTPNATYFSHVDDVINAGAALGCGFILAFAYAGNGGSFGDGWWTEFDFGGDTRCQTYGNTVATRWNRTTFPNVVAWAAGGDYTPPTASRYGSAVTGIKAADAAHLITGHWDQDTFGGHVGILSSDNTPPTSDLDGAYRWEAKAHEIVNRAYGNATVIPIYMIEGVYQNNAGGVTGGTIASGSAQIVRQQNWLATAEGACGAVSGNEAIWQFNSTNPDVPSQAKDLGDWHGHLGDAGIVGVTQWYSFLSARQWWKLVPDRSSALVTAGRGTLSTDTWVGAALASDGSFAFAYLSAAGTITVNMALFSGTVTARWYDPTSGAYTAISTFANSGSHVFTKPGNNAGGDPDWALALDV